METPPNTQYKSADACFPATGAPQTPAGTAPAATKGSFTDDVCALASYKAMPQATADPLFPPKAERNFYGDHVV